MKIEFVPLLQLQRDLYSIPRGQERFQTYLETMLNAGASDVELLPMVVINPMGKAHIPAMLDTLLAMNADAVASLAISKVLNQFGDVNRAFKLGLVVADDQMGGWTNRYTSEFSIRFELQNYLKRGWLAVVLWTSEVPSAEKVREETLITIHRVAYIQRYGFALTLQEMLNQEGYAMAMADCRQPSLDEDDIAYTCKVISPYLSTQDYPTIMACLFGDQAAHLLGYRPHGLSERAGLALALHQAQHNTAQEKYF
ncbi:hypothetical protein XM38_022180 [Halomicronema hongdechloris C2206]|uniref:Uncharacterized protein n=1 Tax=Halomicronema hongdechloris C2206 TaxID=1641165 RepID=A0A1Z3HLW4_9CYAN|nr:hypothetical protein [Halomicronema hongdechloris]ASC71266.1 hypothetical protein XM38_022180 [Halomicronema hongdechloris C2206]